MRLPLIIAALLAASAAQAQRLDTTRMSCGQARDVVARAGAVVLNSGPHIYDRYVASGAFCAVGEEAQASYAPTADAAYCRVGGVCRTPDFRLYKNF